MAQSNVIPLHPGLPLPAQAGIPITRVRKEAGALLSKKIILGEDDRPRSDGSPCAMARGTATRMRLDDGSPARNLAELIGALGSDEALILGNLKPGLPDVVDLERDDVANPAKGTYGRTKKVFEFAAGSPAVMLIDYDRKAMPADVFDRIEKLGGVEGALASLIPGYVDLGRVYRASTSAGLRNTATGEVFEGSGGAHIFLFVQDGADIKRFLEDLHSRAWLAGLGWIMVGKRGSLLNRSIIDVSVGSPERLVFEGPPAVAPPLAQDHAVRLPDVREGKRLDTRKAFPALTRHEENEVKKRVTAAKLAAKPEAEAAIEKAVIDIAEARSIDIDQARVVVESSLNGTLAARDFLQFDDGAIVTVADVLADPGRWHEMTLADPMEGPDYGPGKAKLFWNPDGSVIVNSFAHGSTIYRLSHDAGYIDERMTLAGEDAVTVLATLMLQARVNPVDYDRLRYKAKKLTGVSLTAVKATIKEAEANARKKGRDRQAVEEAEPHAGNVVKGQPVGDWSARLNRMVEGMNEEYFVSTIGGKTRIVKIAYDDVLKRNRLVFSEPRDIKLFFNNRPYMTGHTQAGLEKWKDQGTAWIEHSNRSTYKSMELVFTEPCPPDIYNLWRGFGVVPCEGRWPLIRDHLFNVICSGNEDHYNWLFRWMAHCVQFPGRQAETALVLKGLKGVGKGMVANMLERIFRGHALHISNPKHLLGNFNAHLVDALFLFLDEPFLAGDKAAEGVLKTVITERSIMIEPKGVDSFPMPNRLKILIASNEKWVVPVSAEERRYFVLDVSAVKKGDKKYFVDLAAAIEGDELAAMLHDLLAVDLSAFDHRNPPHTVGLNRQKIVNADSAGTFWHDCLQQGCIVGSDNDTDWPVSIAVNDLHAAYLGHAHNHGDRHPIPIQAFKDALKPFWPGPIRHFKASEAPRHRRYRLDTLDKHRTAFLAGMNIDPAGYDWDPEDSDDGE